MSTSIEYQTIVDENDNVIGKKIREEITPKDIFRVASVWFVDNNQNILLGRRSATKKNDPNKLTTLVNGTVTYNESYLETVKREMLEEVGYSTNTIVPVIKLRIKRDDLNCFVQYFKVEITKETKLNVDPSENSEFVWINKYVLMKLIKEKPEEFVPRAQEIFAKVIRLL